MGTLTALGEMAATVAHEIRNPLGGIGGFAGLLERDLDVGDPRRRLVKKIIEGVDSLNRMVTNLLNYTRPVQLNIRPADLVQVVEDSLGFFEIDAGNRLEQIELQREYAEKELVCRIDPEQIQQMVLNLLHNAVQAMPAGGDLRVGLSETDAGEDERTELSGMCYGAHGDGYGRGYDGGGPVQAVHAVLHDKGRRERPGTGHGQEVRGCVGGGRRGGKRAGSGIGLHDLLSKVKVGAHGGKTDFGGRR